MSIPFSRDPDNSIFEFLKPKEVWRITDTAMQTCLDVWIQRIVKALAWEYSALVIRARRYIEDVKGLSILDFPSVG